MPLPKRRHSRTRGRKRRTHWKIETPNLADCPVSKSLDGLQKYMNSYFQSVTVDDLLNNKHKKRGAKK